VSVAGTAEEHRVASAMLATVREPSTLFARLAAAPEPSLGRNAVLLVGVAWAALSVLLFAGGYRPSRGVAFIPHAQHYLWQAVLLPSLLVFGWLVGAGVADAVARALGGPPALAALRATLGLAWAVPIGLLFVLPDLVVVVTRGHAALATAMVWYVPAALLWSFALGWHAVRATTRLPALQAALVVVAAYATQGLVISLVVR
jgi:hypothetical protein